MRTVLVCVRTPLAAQAVATTAARLGVAGAVRTAVTEPEAMLRLAERPADVVLADTAVTRPDSVGFTRRVLARSPGAVIVLFGAEDPRAAAATVAAGARGVIRGAEQDMVSVVAKAVLLLCLPARPPAGARPAGAGAAPAAVAGQVRATAGAVAEQGAASALGMMPGRVPTQVVPSQRGDFGDPGDGLGDLGRGGWPASRPGESELGREPEPAARRIALTERELQVLRGMSDGKSNAEIGRELFVSEDTVKTHARRLFRKLGARDRAHAVAAGFRAGLVD
ncbi:helix-turn-helix transcriptional regulator [Catenuloplanes indicus]|uniref:helix-turn-helix transcriptional regulator n=1 Tax=Catenuloplanes indicus TaxID=137267 RepID=UPI0027D84732|nr:response regulator transcription factor [Catenuloplanes indicus]